MATATLNEAVAADKSAILALLEGISRAHYNKDAAAIEAVYTQGAAIFNLAPPLTHHGINRQEKQAWLDSWDGPVEIESRDFDVTVSGDFAFCHGFMRMEGKKKGADRRVNFWMRETLCLHREGPGWKIVHEHTSVPFYMDDSVRPAFDLKP